MLEREVQRFNERKEFERQVGFLCDCLPPAEPLAPKLSITKYQIALVELILPFMEYMEAKRYYTDVKAKQRSLHKRVQTLQQKNQPIHDFKKQLDTRLKRLDEQRDGKKEAARRRFRAMGAKRDESEKLVCHSPLCLPFFIYLAFPQDTQAEEISNKLSNLKNTEKARAKKIQDIEATVQRLQADLEKPRDVENMDDIEGEVVRSFPLLLNASRSNELGTARSQPK